MLQMTYISTVTPQFTEGDLESILAASRRNNAAAGLTGLLLFNGQRFLQHLEGEEAMVMRAYDRIKVDPRHRAIVLLSRKHLPERVFAHWDMAFEHVDTRLPDTLPLEDQVAAIVAHVDPAVAAHFMGFAALRRTAAA